MNEAEEERTDSEWPPTVTIAVPVALAGIGGTYGLWYLLVPTAQIWIRHGGLWTLAGVVMLLAISLPLFPGGLALFYLLISPLMAYSDRQERKQRQAMRDAVSVVAALDPNIRRVWLIDYHEVPTAAREHQLVVHAEGRIAVDLEPLRAAIDALRQHHRCPLVLRIESPAADDERTLDTRIGHALFQRRDASVG